MTSRFSWHKHYIDLVPELKSWNEKSPVSVDDWLGLNGNHELALAFTSLFWPDFKIHDNCVFFENAFSQENYDLWMKTTGGDRKAVELVINHQHILELFPQHSPDPSEKLVIELGKKLQEIWQAKLQRDFPKRRIVVEFPLNEVSDLLDYQIYVYHAE